MVYEEARGKEREEGEYFCKRKEGLRDCEE